MKRTVASMVAALLLLLGSEPVAADPPGPFTEIPLQTRAPGSHRWAYVTMAAGVALIGASFAAAKRADRTYDDYLVSTDPDLIDRLYDRTVRYDRLSAASLLTGEACIAGGLYIRFLRRSPSPARLSLTLGPDRCAALWRF